MTVQDAATLDATIRQTRLNFRLALDDANVGIK
jgi:hypothetical protein